MLHAVEARNPRKRAHPGVMAVASLLAELMSNQYTEMEHLFLCKKKGHIIDDFDHKWLKNEG